MQTYYYVLASQSFLIEEEPIEEVLRERTRNYHEQEKEIDFWLVKQPAFLEAPEMLESMSPAICGYYFHQFPVYYLAETAFRVRADRAISSTF